jgi:hypothetical protein
MAGNIIRDTPGRLLLGWAALLSTLVILAWRIHLHPADYEWTEYPTALGDVAYYTAIGAEDLYEANLKLPGEEKGHFRRSEVTMTRDDAGMMKLRREASGRFFIYKPAGEVMDGTPPLYLKAGENAYVEFGPRKFYKAYEPKVK